MRVCYSGQTKRNTENEDEKQKIKMKNRYFGFSTQEKIDGR